MATEQDQIEAMRQMVGAALKQMGSDLEGFGKKAKDQSSEGGGLKQMDKLFEGMTRSLVGPVGLGAAIYSVAKSLENFAAGRVQLQNFSTDVGASVSTINAMSAAMDKAGISVEAGNQSIATMGRLVKDMAARGQGSELATLLRDTGHTANEIQKMIDTSRTNIDQAMLDTIKVLNEGNSRYRSYVATQTGIAESHLQAMQNTQHEMGKVYVSDLEAAKKWHEGWVEISTQISNVWSEIKDNFVKYMVNGGALDFMKATPEERLKMYGLDKAEDRPKTEPDWLQKILDPVGNKQWPFSGSQKLSDILGNSAGSFPPSGSNFNDRFGAWPNKLIDVQQNSDKTLTEIRDSLLRMETGEGAGGSTGGAPGKGIPGIPGGPVAPFKFGGSATGAQRSAGGGAGITAPAGTPMQGGMATVTAPDGKTFQVDPEFKDNFKGFIDDYYKAGGKFGGSTGTMGFRPGNASGHPIGDAIDINQTGRGIRSQTGTTLPPAVEDSLASKWGFVSGNSWKDNDQGHFGIRSREAARDALIKNGVLPSEADKIVSSGKGSWFDDHITASGADASKIAGIALPSREGLGKMHEVTGPDGNKIMLPQIDVGPAKWTGRGIDFSKPAMKKLGYDPTDKTFSFHQADSDRAKIDQSQSFGSRFDAAMSATVDFKNMPSWVKTAVDDNGKFKNLRVSRSTPQAGKASSPQGDLQNWSYE